MQFECILLLIIVININGNLVDLAIKQYKMCLIDTIHSINKLNDNNNPNRLVLLGKNENEAIDNDYLHKTLIFSFLLAIQYGLQPILASAFTSRTISKTSVVIMTEFGKILIAIVGLATGLVVKSDDWSLQNSIQIAALPALLYAVQNVFVQYVSVLIFHPYY